MSTPGDDSDLDDFLSRSSDVSRRYRSSGGTSANEEPPAELDRAVLAKARAAVSLPDTVRELPVRSRARWRVPFALAATVLLSFAIFREAGLETGGVLSESDVLATAPTTPPDPLESDLAATSRSDELAAVTATAAPGVARESTAEAERVADNQAAIAQKSAESLAAFSDSVTEQPPAAAPSPEAAKAEAPPPTAAFPIRRAANVAQSAAPAPSQTAAEPVGERRSPEVWLEDVRQLRAKGLEIEADAELQLFLEANPDYFDRNPGIPRP